MRRLGLAVLVLLGLGVALAAWAFLVEPRLLATRHRTLALEGWPADYPPLEVALLADLHIGSPYNDLERLADIVGRTNAERPDAVLLLGDYVVQEVLGGRYVPPEEFAPVLGRLEAPLGVFAVLGNHDWWDDGGRIGHALAAAGITVLENQAVRVAFADRPLWIGGIADDTTRSPDIPATLGQVTNDAPVLLMAHDPAVYLDLPARPVLMTAGHTHGGQVWVPGIGALVTPSRAPLDWTYGHIVEQGRHVYVSGGIGTSLLPLRFNMPPEIVILTIVAEG